MSSSNFPNAPLTPEEVEQVTRALNDTTDSALAMCEAAERGGLDRGRVMFFAGQLRGLSYRLTSILGADVAP